VFGVASNASGGVGVWGEANNAGTGVGVWGVNSNAGGWAGYFSGRLGVTGTPFANQTTFALFSDARLKKNVKPLEGALEKLLQLRGVTFEWKNPAEHGNLEGRQTGFIAQDVEKVFPNWVTDDPSGFKTMTTRGLEAMLIESLRTLKNENDQNLRTLKNENDELRVRIRALEGTRGIVKSDVGFGGWGVAALLLFGGVVAISARRRPRTGA
jgi:hypothetical protein